ncbi:hypothetical protein BDZ91DRAFT_784463 [Kalaharituber pfeilii]|nr:hypothetical protein BDZ91DRAFT_784463 [Kalaharituber pfeilii]
MTGDIMSARPLSSTVQEEIKPWLSGNYPTWQPGQPFPLVASPAKVTGIYHADEFNRVASHMSIVHNTIIRGLNSIYLQARKVAPTQIHAATTENSADVKTRDDFVAYAKEWSTMLHIHHDNEETHFFPDIEKLTGVIGLMDRNIEQHRAFDGGVELFDKYLEQVTPPANPKERVGADKFLYGEEMVRLIEGFGQPLVAHLTEEMGSLLALKEYRDVLDIGRLFDEESEKIMKSVSFSGVLSWFMHNMDIEYEGGIHKEFPPAPWFVLWQLRNVSWWPGRAKWRFSSCTRKGQLREKLLFE